MVLEFYRLIEGAGTQLVSFYLTAFSFRLFLVQVLLGSSQFAESTEGRISILSVPYPQPAL